MEGFARGRRGARRETLTGVSVGGGTLPAEVASTRRAASTLESVHGGLGIGFFFGSILPVLSFEAAEVEGAAKRSTEGIGGEGGGEDCQRPDIKKTSLCRNGRHLAVHTIGYGFVVDSDHDLDEQLEDASEKTDHLEFLDGVISASFLGPVATFELLFFRFRLSSKVKQDEEYSDGDGEEEGDEEEGRNGRGRTITVAAFLGDLMKVIAHL